MCQTASISQSIVRLGTRSYRHSLEALEPGAYHVSQLRRLNCDLDAFYDFLYSHINTVTERDYNVFGKQLVSMLNTLEMLYASCKQMPEEYGVGAEAEKLRMNHSALSELNSDIMNFRVKASKDGEWSGLLSEAGLALQNVRP